MKLLRCDILVFYCAILICDQFSEGAIYHCADNYTLFSGTSGAHKCLKFVEDRDLDWYSAQDDCQISGGHLVTIQDADMNTFIMNTSKTNGPFWIGAQGTTQKWIWHDDRTELTYFKWERGQPNVTRTGSDWRIVMNSDMGGWSVVHKNQDEYNCKMSKVICQYGGYCLKNNWCHPSGGGDRCDYDDYQRKCLYVNGYFGLLTDEKSCKTKGRTWDESVSDCLQNKGGSLLKVVSKETQEEVYKKLKTDRQFGGFYWIGAVQDGSQLTWRWSSGEPFSYTGQLNGTLPSMGHTHLYLSVNERSWKAAVGDERHAYICEYEPFLAVATTTDTSTTEAITTVNKAQTSRLTSEAGSESPTNRAETATTASKAITTSNLSQTSEPTQNPCVPSSGVSSEALTNSPSSTPGIGVAITISSKNVTTKQGIASPMKTYPSTFSVTAGEEGLVEGLTSDMNNRAKYWVIALIVSVLVALAVVAFVVFSILSKKHRAHVEEGRKALVLFSSTDNPLYVEDGVLEQQHDTILIPYIGIRPFHDASLQRQGRSQHFESTNLQGSDNGRICDS